MKKVRIKPRVEEMLKFHMRRKVQKHKSKKDYNRKNKDWKDE
jgi:hypothetical protein